MQIQLVDYRATDADKALTESLHETGFAVLTNHCIEAERIDEAYRLWADFFASQEKFTYLRNPDTQDGYFPFKSENAKGASAKDLKEFYHVYSWGKVPDALTDITYRLFDDLRLLGTELLGWLDQNLPTPIAKNLTASLPQMMEGSEQNLLRILHYPPLEDKVDAEEIRAAAHEDINLMTLLLSGSAPGLQAQDTQGIWHDVPCNPRMITINSGDMLALATDNYFPSTTHQVINPDKDMNASRYSMPMFLHPRPDIDLKQGFTANQFLQERLKEIGLK